MASTAIIITLFIVTTANVVFASAKPDGFPFGSKMFNYVNPRPFPQFPNFNLPFLWNFPPMPTFTPPPALTFDDIAEHGAEPGSTYTGIAAVSHSSSARGPDGKIQNDGGSTVLLNDNGLVTTMQQTGNQPPVVLTFPKVSFPDFPELEDFKMPAMPKMKPFSFEMPKMKPFHFNMPTFKPFVFEPPVMPTLNPDTIKNYVPGKNEKFQGTYVSSNSYSSNVNGVKTSGGEVSSIVNDNGKVDEENLAFKKVPK